MTILLVEDDAPHRAMLGLSLRQGGHRVLDAGTGEEGLLLLKKNAFDWLITDAKMAPMDGFLLAREAKRLRPSLRILMVSATCTNGDICGHPIEKCFQKPVAPEALLDWIGSQGADG